MLRLSASAAQPVLRSWGRTCADETRSGEATLLAAMLGALDCMREGGSAPVGVAGPYPGRPRTAAHGSCTCPNSETLSPHHALRCSKPRLQPGSASAARPAWNRLWGLV